MEDWMIVLLVAYGVLAFAWAGFTCAVATAKGYGEVAWFFGGLLFGPIAMLAAIGLPRREQNPRVDYQNPYMETERRRRPVAA